MIPPAVIATQFQAAVDKTKRLLVHGPAGVNGIRSLSRSFGIAEDTGGTATLSRVQLAVALKENAVQLGADDLEAIFATLDRHRVAAIDPADFIAALRVAMTPLRRAWVRRAWDALLTLCGSEGAAEADMHCAAVSVETLQACYRAKLHPDVLRGRRGLDDVAQEFAATFNRTTNPDGLISHLEFTEYYSGVSASYVDDESFIALLRGVWPMPQVDEATTLALARGEHVLYESFTTHDTVQQKQRVTAARVLQAELRRVVSQEQRAQIMASALMVRRLALALRRACYEERTGDDVPGTFISQNAFLAVLRAHRLYFTDEALLAALDTNGDGSVDTLYYLELLLPPMPAPRQLMLARLWRVAFSTKDGQDRVNVYELQRSFCTESGQERSDFLSSWDVRTALHGKVSLDELVEWYAPQSAQVATDKDFELLLQRQWPAARCRAATA